MSKGYIPCVIICYISYHPTLVLCQYIGAFPVHKGHTRLDMREEPVLFPPGFQPFALVQCQPPAVVTALTLHSEWKLVAFGTSHGFGLYDYQQKNNVFVK